MVEWTAARVAWLAAGALGTLMAWAIALVVARLGRGNPALRRLALFLGGQGALCALLTWGAVGAETNDTTSGLIVAIGAGAAGVALWSAAGLAFSSVRKERVYRAAVATAVQDGRLTPDERAMLDRLAGELLLSGKHALEIERELHGAGRSAAD